jgi:serine/threonine-protein kinase HipA
VADDDGRSLVVLIGGSRAGLVRMNADGRFTLTYDDTWRDLPEAIPLSLSLPLGRTEHADAPVRAFLWGLLPDNERVLERWAQTFQVSSGNPFALLRHVGEDCAGAVQFVRSDRVDAILAGDGGVRPLDENEVAQRLRALRADPTAWHVHNAGHFSLAGAQAKTALHLDPETGQWGEPWGAVPTTHILKPAVTGLDDHDLNEHLCLVAARIAGLPAAISHVLTFGRERVIAVERYDRRHIAPDRTVRVHQEDMCQALGVMPTAKYQSDGGPGPDQIVDLLRRSSVSPAAAAENVDRFSEALAFNWLIGGTDAHAKNYSILSAPGQWRLAPLYDVATALVYDDMYVPKLRMAMRVGSEYGLEAISGRHWRRLAIANGLDDGRMIERIDALAERLPDAFAESAKSDGVKRLRSSLPQRLSDRISGRLPACRARLKR